jgi:hypothetical protein
MKQSFFVIFCFSSVLGLSHAATYVSNFDSAPYTFGANLNGLDGWSLSGASLPDVAKIAASPFPSPVSGGQGIYFGFQEIDASSAYLQRSGGDSLVGNGAGYTQFQAAFTVQDSVPTYPKRDSFAFTFRGASNQNLLTINLSPTIQSETPQFEPFRVDQYSWSSDFAAGNANIGNLTERQWSTLNVLFTPSGVSDVAFSVKFQGVQAAAGILTGAASQILGTYGFVWTPLNAADEGSNVLLIDDVSLVPEPSSSLLLCLAGLGLLARRKRA